MPRFRWFRKTDIVCIVILSIGGYCYLRWFERASIWIPTREIVETPANAGIDFEDVYFETEDGVRLNGWFIPAEDAIGAVLYCHGNGFNLGSHYAHVLFYRDLGYHVFLFDYRGYGQSKGWPTEHGTYQDGHAAYRWLKEKVPDLPIVLHGWSLGAAIATELATQVETAALINECGFTSIEEIARDRYPFIPVKLLATVEYDSISKLHLIQVPVLIIYSPDDRIIPPRHGEDLFAAANEPKQKLAIPGGHECADYAPDVYREGIAQFLSAYNLLPAVDSISESG